MQMFYKAPQGWCADFIPFYKDGVYYLFYLHDYRDVEKQGEGTPWYLLTTKDFVHFQEHGEVLPRGTREEGDLYVFTGCVFEDSRKVTDYPYHIYYTAHNPYFPDKGLPMEKVVHAVSKDLFHWEKRDDLAYQAPEGYERHDWRDPFVWYSEEKQAYCMLTAARFESGPSQYRGCTALSVSRDLLHWQPEAPLLAEGSYYTHECPDYFEWNGWYYLIFSEFSSMCRTHYRVAKSPFGPWVKPQDDVFDSRAFYAAKTAGDGKKRYLFGWNPTRQGENDTGGWMWGGSLVVHEVKQREDGSLYTALPESVSVAFPATKQAFPAASWGNVRRDGNALVLDAVEKTALAACGAMQERLALKVRFEPDREVSEFGVTLHLSDDMSRMYMVRYEKAGGRLVFGKVPGERSEWPFLLETERLISLPEDEAAELTVYVQGSILEAYLTCGGKTGTALSSRMYDLSGGSFGLYARGGRVKAELLWDAVD